jgi:hypothetical protein
VRVLNKVVMHEILDQPSCLVHLRSGAQLHVCIYMAIGSGTLLYSSTLKQIIVV